MRSSDARPWTAVGNDYRGIERVDPGPPPTLAIVLSGDESQQERTFDALGAQVYEGQLQIVGIAESSLPVKAGDWPVTPIAPSAPLDEAIHPADVVVLLSYGQMPEPAWLERHVQWHRRARNIVVLGETRGHDRSAESIRRSRHLLSSDEAFAAMRSSNISLRRANWAQYPELDVKAGWHLWNEGLFFVYDPAAKVSVVEQEAQQPDQGDDPLLLEDQIPHRRYRSVPSALHRIPKVSWVVGVTKPEEASWAWRTCQESAFPDCEILLHGPSTALGEFTGLAAGNNRVSVVAGDGADSFSAAVSKARGELIAIVDSRARIAPETLTKAVARFESKPSAPIVRVGYGLGGDRYLRLDDLAAVDEELGNHGLSLFALVTRRELMKDASLLADPGAAWRSVLDRTKASLVVSPLVEFNDESTTPPRMPGLAEVPSIGLREIAREAVRAARRRRASTATAELIREPSTGEDTDKVSVAYVGFTGHDNLGDEAVRIAIERLMPWAAFEAEPADPKLLMVGGGTLINGRRYYLTRLLRQESATMERALFGTGVRSPEYWGVTEPMEDWFSFIDAALVAAVRGPDSVKNLRTLGYHRDLPVIGDPALSLKAPANASRVEGRIVICPVYTDGNLHGGNDDVVFDALAEFIGKMAADGREVVMLSAFPRDDRWVIDLMRRANAPDLPYVPGYADIDATMGLLASADLVVGERLHAVIMAAAAGTPFVGLEYRPKMRDFARSVDQEDAVIRTDEMQLLDSVCARVLAEREDFTAAVAFHVSEYRKLQEASAADLRRRFLGH